MHEAIEKGVQRIEERRLDLLNVLRRDVLLSNSASAS